MPDSQINFIEIKIDVLTPKKIKVMFIIPSLKAGGAERVISFISQNISQERFEPRLVVIKSKEEAKYDVDGIEVSFLNHMRVSHAFFSLLKELKSHKPDVVIGTLSHVNFLLAVLSFFFRRTRFVGREANVPSYLSGIIDVKNSKIRGTLIRIGYKFLDRIICQSEDMKSDLISNMGLSEHHLKIINNPISSQFTTKKSIAPFKNGYRLITVGRLSKQKGYDRLLKVLREINLNFHYTIIGDGPERESIMKFIKIYEMENRVSIIPYTNEVHKYLSDSHIYLQGSYVEGFPNALIESLAVGTPAIVFEAPGGINEIMIDGENGFVVKNEDEFINKTLFIIENLHEWTPIKVSQTVISKFSKEKIVREYEDFILSLV